jgi:hypothetical protein
MAIYEAQEPGKPRIDLAGPDGNVFALMATARSLSRKLGLDFEDILDDMKASDYHHAVYVFDKHFGQYVDLILPPGITESDIVVAALSK